MRRSVLMRFALSALATFGAACSSQYTTAVQLALAYQPGWNLDELEIAAEDRTRRMPIDAEMIVLLPDAWAGSMHHLQLWGLHAGIRAAYGEVMVVPAAQRQVHYPVTLALCGTLCPGGGTDGGTDGGADGSPAGSLDAGPGGGRWLQVSVGYAHACGIRQSQGISCWGDATYGETSAPAGAFAAVSSGYYAACAIRATDRGVACWGLGFSAPTPGGPFRAVATGASYACGVTSDGMLVCFGDPTKIPAGAPTGIFTTIAAGMTHACAIRSNGTLACWGTNTSGECNAPDGRFAAVSVGDTYSCALRSGGDGGISCWGSPSNNQTSAPFGPFDSLHVGASHGCAISATHGSATATAACWGSSSQGESTVPVAGPVTDVSAGATNTCIIQNSGGIVCWGQAGPLNMPPL